MRTYRLFVCYFLFLTIGVTVTAFVDRSPEGFKEHGEIAAAMGTDRGT
jgi:hypothetical protein